MYRLSNFRFFWLNKLKPWIFVNERRRGEKRFLHLLWALLSVLKAVILAAATQPANLFGGTANCLPFIHMVRDQTPIKFIKTRQNE